jgi:hypothetical protein
VRTGCGGGGGAPGRSVVRGASLRSAMKAARRRPAAACCVAGLLLLSLACNTCFTCLFPALTNSRFQDKAARTAAAAACLSLRQPKADTASCCLTALRTRPPSTTLHATLQTDLAQSMSQQSRT